MTVWLPLVFFATPIKQISGLRLTNTRPGKGHVSVANGQREPIMQSGKLGPLQDVQKVKSFHRVLISVAQLCKQYEQVVFNGGGASLATKVGGKHIVTKIGLATVGNLFSFQLEALRDHDAKVELARREEKMRRTRTG